MKERKAGKGYTKTEGHTGMRRLRPVKEGKGGMKDIMAVLAAAAAGVVLILLMAAGAALEAAGRYMGGM